MRTRTVGVEEELLVVDPTTRAVTSRAREVLRAHAEQHAERHGERGRESGPHEQLDQELFRHQLETRTEPTRDVGDVIEQLAAARRSAGEAAAGRGLAVAACASVPWGAEEPEVTPDDRYRDMLETYGAVARLGTTCGMHVHVGIESPEEGVGCLDRIAPWLPVLLAMSVNSPFAQGTDTGYASWRTVQWSSWPSAGPTEAFGSLEGYRRVRDRMLESGAARDPGMLYFDARLSEGQPTLEVRLLDTVTDLPDAGVLAALVRALVETAAGHWSEDVEPPPWRCEELRAARWRAARFGTAEDLLDPVDHRRRPARQVVTSLVDLVSDRLTEAGDLDRVRTGVERLLAATGASRQRAAHERSGALEGVVDDLLSRTEDSWPSSERD